MSEPEWTTLAAAAELAGCSRAAVWEAVQRGEIVQRPDVRQNAPSLDPESVDQWVEARRQRLELVDQRRVARVAYRADVAHRHRFGGRSDDEHDWLSTEQVAQQFGVSRRWVNRLTNEERLPSTKIGRRRWLRRDHVEMYLTARAVEGIQAERLSPPQHQDRPTLRGEGGAAG